MEIFQSNMLGTRLLFKPSDTHLEKLGYKQLPVHSYSHVKVDKQWFTNVKFPKPCFPRFHISKLGKDYYLHCDLIKDHFDGRGIIIDHRDPILSNEIKRLKYL